MCCCRHYMPKVLIIIQPVFSSSAMSEDCTEQRPGDRHHTGISDG